MIKKITSYKNKMRTRPLNPALIQLYYINIFILNIERTSYFPAKPSAKPE